MLDITVFGVPELAQKTRVSATGDIYMPLVDTVHLAGLNLDEAQTGIETKLASGKFLKNPHVNITVTEYASGVVLMGEVAKPGIYQVAGSSRLFALLSAAGGTTPNAGKSITIAHRDDPKQETVQLSGDPQLNADANIFVRKGDIVTVSRAGVIYVVGNVVQPSGFMMEGKSEFTALKALAMAHGPAKAAALNGARILRRTPDGVREIPAPLKKIMAAKAPDITMQAEDILYIPNSAGKSAAYRGVDYALSLATGVAIISTER
jgi:polysaccharide export outer membrane protein